MTRMSKEFTLVLLGSGILTAGYFTVPSAEEEMEKKAEEQAAHRTGHTHYHRHHGIGFIPLFIHSHGYAGSATGRPAAHSATTRSGGFGSVGRAFSGGGS
jgi:hypothetical protein